MKIYLSAFLMMILVVGCNNQDKDISTTFTDTTKQNGGEAPVPVVISPLPDTVFAGEKDTTIELVDGTAIIMGHIKPNHQPVYTLKASKGQTIVATVKPVNKSGNIRINQVQKPDKTFDGPFGDSLQFTFQTSGMLRFIIGQNLMAGDRWTGDYIFRVRVEK